MPPMDLSEELLRLTRDGFLFSVSRTQYLINNKNVNLNYQDPDGMTPLCWAAYHGQTFVHSRIVNLLVQAGASVHIRNKRGMTPLHYAARTGHVSAIKLLIEHKADINAQNSNGLTPLHEAANEGQFHAVKLLLQNSCKLTILDMNGRTAYDCCRHEQIRELLSTANVGIEKERMEKVFRNRVEDEKKMNEDAEKVRLRLEQLERERLRKSTKAANEMIDAMRTMSAVPVVPYELLSEWTKHFESDHRLDINTSIMTKDDQFAAENTIRWKLLLYNAVFDVDNTSPSNELMTTTKPELLEQTVPTESRQSFDILSRLRKSFSMDGYNDPPPQNQIRLSAEISTGNMKSVAMRSRSRSDRFNDNSRDHTPTKSSRTLSSARKNSVADPSLDMIPQAILETDDISKDQVMKLKQSTYEISDPAELILFHPEYEATVGNLTIFHLSESIHVNTKSQLRDRKDVGMEEKYDEEYVDSIFNEVKYSSSRLDVEILQSSETKFITPLPPSPVDINRFKGSLEWFHKLKHSNILQLLGYSKHLKLPPIDKKIFLEAAHKSFDDDINSEDESVVDLDVNPSDDADGDWYLIYEGLCSGQQAPVQISSERLTTLADYLHLELHPTSHPSDERGSYHQGIDWRARLHIAYGISCAFCQIIAMLPNHPELNHVISHLLNDEMDNVDTLHPLFRYLFHPFPTPSSLYPITLSNILLHSLPSNATDSPGLVATSQIYHNQLLHPKIVLLPAGQFIDLETLAEKQTTSIITNYPTKIGNLSTYLIHNLGDVLHQLSSDQAPSVSTASVGEEQRLLLDLSNSCQPHSTHDWHIEIHSMTVTCKDWMDGLAFLDLLIHQLHDRLQFVLQLPPTTHDMMRKNAQINQLYRRLHQSSQQILSLEEQLRHFVGGINNRLNCLVCGDCIPSVDGIHCGAVTKHFLCNECFKSVNMSHQLSASARKAFIDHNCMIVCQFCLAETDKKVIPFTERELALHCDDKSYENYRRACKEVIEIEIFTREEKRNELQFNELKRDLAKARDMFTQRIHQHRKYVADDILTLKCPNPDCRMALFDIEKGGCFAMTCSQCIGKFCGWCLKDCGQGVNSFQHHDHVRGCSSNVYHPGDVNGTMEEFDQVHAKRRKEMLRHYLLHRVASEEREAVMEAIASDISSLGIDLTMTNLYQ